MTATAITPARPADNRKLPLTEGFWFCLDCNKICEREEGEHGQPAHCALCDSHRLKYHPPVWKNLVGVS